MKKSKRKFAAYLLIAASLTSPLANFNVHAQEALVSTGTLTAGLGGAVWRLYESGTVVVEGGNAQPFLGGTLSPWHAYSSYITNIIFTSPVNVIGVSAAGIFRDLYNLERIEGLYNLNTSNVLIMNNMFLNSGLKSLDLNISTSNLLLAMNKFENTNNLRYLTLGKDFSLLPNTNLPQRYWINTETGEIRSSEYLTSGSWVWYESRSLDEIRVLSINPHNNASHTFARFFREWVNGAGGSNQNLHRNRNLNPLNSYGNPTIVFEEVTTYQLTRRENNRNFVDIEALLRDAYGNYRFDIIAIGSWEYGGIIRYGNEPHIISAISDFMDSGGAVIFGHTTLADRHRTSHGRGTTAQTNFGSASGTLLDGHFYRNPLNRKYGMNYLFAPLAHRAGVIPSQRVDRFAHRSNTVARKFAVITEQGPLTTYPFAFEVGQVIPISITNNNGSLTTGTVWAQFVERQNNGNFRLNPYRNMPGGNVVVDFAGRYITEAEWGNRHRNMSYAQSAFQPAGVYQSNAFISTFENTAHIQSWRGVNYLTLEERKLFVNTIFYLANRGN